MKSIKIIISTALLFCAVTSFAQQAQQQPMVIDSGAQRTSLFERLFKKPAQQQQQLITQPTPTPERATADRRTHSSSNTARKATKDSGSATKKAAKTDGDNSAKKADDAKKAEDAAKKAEDEAKADDVKSPAEELAKTNDPKKAEEDKKAAAAREAEIKRLDEMVGKATSAASTFLNAANKGLYSKAQLMLVPQQQDFFSGAESVARGISLKALLDSMTRDGQITKWQVTSNVRGEGCRVAADLTYKTGQTSRVIFDMIMLGDVWRIQLLNLEKIAMTETPAVVEAPADASAAAPTKEDATPTSPAAEAKPLEPSNATPADVIASLTQDTDNAPSDVTTATVDAPWRR